jgi:hypothetical protein
LKITVKEGRIMPYRAFRLWLVALGAMVVLSMGVYLAVTGQALAGSAGQPKLWVTPLILDFGPVGVGMASPTQMVTITNLGTATLAGFAGGGVYAPFGASQNCAGGVAPGGKCQYYFTFRPTAAGSFTTTSSSGSNGGPFSIELRGQGVGAGLSVSALSLDFGSVYVDGGVATQAVEIRNTGMSTLTNFAGGGVYAPFGASQDCAAGVPPGGHCHYYFTFDPSAAGSYSTTSNSGSNAGPFSIALKGSGRIGIMGSGQYVSPLIIDFGPVGVGLQSPQRLVTITNQSWMSTITSWAGGGVYPPFAAQQDCASGVAPGANCRYYFRFSPTAAGQFTAVSSSSNSFGSFSIELRGTGVGAGLTVSPLALDFGPVPLGITSPPQTVTIRNTGMSTLTNFAGGGVYAPFNATQNCASGVPPGGKCNYFFKFTPTAPGRYTAVSSSGSNAGGFSIRLYGGELLKVYLPLVLRD